MSDLRIVYPNGTGGVAVDIPLMNNAINDETGEWYPLLTVNDPLPEGFRLCTVEDIAARIVPEGTPFEVIEASELPDRATRNAWEWV